MIVVRSKLAVDAIPAGTTRQIVDVFVGDQCFMERYGETINAFWRLPNASFSSSDETLLKMPTDWVVPHIYRSYQVVQWHVGLNSQQQHLKVWYQEESQGIYRIEEQVLKVECEVQPQAQKGQQPQAQKGQQLQVQKGQQPQAQKGQQLQAQKGQQLQVQKGQQRRKQVATMTRNVTIPSLTVPLTVPK